MVEGVAVQLVCDVGVAEGAQGGVAVQHVVVVVQAWRTKENSVTSLDSWIGFSVPWLIRLKWNNLKEKQEVKDL